MSLPPLLAVDSNVPLFVKVEPVPLTVAVSPPASESRMNVPSLVTFVPRSAEADPAVLLPVTVTVCPAAIVPFKVAFSIRLNVPVPALSVSVEKSVSVTELPDSAPPDSSKLAEFNSIVPLLARVPPLWVKVVDDWLPPVSYSPPAEDTLNV